MLLSIAASVGLQNYNMWKLANTVSYLDFLNVQSIMNICRWRYIYKGISH
jgi:hypothetical protein